MSSQKYYNIAGKPRVYNTDGSGRDTYVGFDNGGNTQIYQASKGCYTKLGQFCQVANATYGYPKQSAPQIKTVHYHADGTGRDTYIHNEQGGFMNNYRWHKQENTYVSALRAYGDTVQSTQACLAAQSKGRSGLSPMKDFFVEGQVSIRHPQWRQYMSMTQSHQRNSVERLAVPRKSAEHFSDLVHHAAYGETPEKKSFLRSSRDLNFTPQQKKIQQFLSPDIKRLQTKHKAQSAAKRRNINVI